MISKLEDYLLKKENTIKIEKDWIYIDSVIATPIGIYGFKTFQNEEELMDSWMDSCSELSTKVQANISNQLDNLRWDIYLIFFIENPISTSTRKIIENDKKFFKKIVISNNEIDQYRIPFILNILDDGINDESGAKSILPQENIFLTNLKSTLSGVALEMFGDEFFIDGDKFDAKKIYQLLKENKEIIP